MLRSISSVSSSVSFAAGLLCLILFGCSKNPTQPKPLAAPTVTTPGDGAQYVPDTLTLVWAPSPEATSYSVQLSTDNTFSTVTYSYTSSSPSYAITTPLLNNTTYYLRVSASVGGQRTSPWSTATSFTTGVAAPGLLSPSSGQIFMPDTFTFTWYPQNGAITYYLQLSTDADFSTTIIDDSTTVPNYALTTPLTLSTMYYWRVSVTTTQGASGWGVSSNNFSTVDSLPAPVMLSPADQATGVAPLTDLLQWTPITATQQQWAVAYHVQVWSDTTDTMNTSNLVTDQTTLSEGATTTCSDAITSLTAGTTYYWRVASQISIGGLCNVQGAWAPFWTFTTAP